MCQLSCASVEDCLFTVESQYEEGTCYGEFCQVLTQQGLGPLVVFKPGSATNVQLTAPDPRVPPLALSTVGPKGQQERLAGGKSLW